MVLLQDVLDKEGLTDFDVKMLDLINDRGTQMETKAFMKMCKDLGITQKFARPKTPNDNPFVESLFPIVKGYPRYPDVFLLTILMQLPILLRFLLIINNERFHGKIGFITPLQKYNG